VSTTFTKKEETLPWKTLYSKLPRNSLPSWSRCTLDSQIVTEFNKQLAKARKRRIMEETVKGGGDKWRRLKGKK
jgi:hypothetical protein